MPSHPFRIYFKELQIGETLITKTHTVREDDIINFAELSGRELYAICTPIHWRVLFLNAPWHTGISCFHVLRVYLLILQTNLYY